MDKVEVGNKLYDLQNDRFIYIVERHDAHTYYCDVKEYDYVADVWTASSQLFTVNELEKMEFVEVFASKYAFDQIGVV